MTDRFCHFGTEEFKVMGCLCVAPVKFQTDNRSTSVNASCPRLGLVHTNQLVDVFTFLSFVCT